MIIGCSEREIEAGPNVRANATLALGTVGNGLLVEVTRVRHTIHRLSPQRPQGQRSATPRSPRH
jgi:hypothetical protein